MSKVKISKLLSDMVKNARSIGDKPSENFTAERFIVALIDKTAKTPNNEKNLELVDSELILFEMFAALERVSEQLTEYIRSDEERFDKKYMLERWSEANELAMENENQIVTANMLLKVIFKTPTKTIKLYIDKNNDIMPEEDRFDLSTETPDKESNRQSGEIEIVAEGTVDSYKSEMTDLVTEVKQIRKHLKQTVFGQDNAINTFATGYFQARLLSMIDKSRQRPAATFLFAGPPGVGKTFLAEGIAQNLGLPFARFDMSEYSSHEASIEFCGSDKVYKNGKSGNVTEFVSKNPKCVLLFDEIEKAHLSIIHLFLQMLDAGRIRDNYTDEVISLKDAIIILTTNAGKQLYSDSESGDFSGVSRKVIIKALQNDTNPINGQPFFPAAICSRFASGNVVMFNRIGVNSLKAVAKKEIKRHADNLKAQMGISLNIDEQVYTALLYSEGANVDARTIRARAETFFNDELFELLRLVSGKKSADSVAKLENINVSLDLENSSEEIKDLFRLRDEASMLVFADAEIAEKCRAELPMFNILSTSSSSEAQEILRQTEIDFALIDIKCGAQDSTALNIEDAYSGARDLFRLMCSSYRDIPIYFAQREKEELSDEEKVSFMRQGVRDFFSLSSLDDFALKIKDLFVELSQQKGLASLAKANKLVSFETLQRISQDGGSAEIVLFDFALKVAVDSEDAKNIMSSVSKPNVKFEDVIGAQDAKEELKYFVQYLKNPKKYLGTGVKPPKGVLLYGPPGTGKTLLAKAMASEANVTFIVAEGNQFLKRYVGEGPQAVHELFRVARKYAPAILFVDEIDAIGKERRGSDDGNTDDILTAFLTEMDGFSSQSKPVFVLAATNFEVEAGGPRSLDSALIRRFDRRVFIDLPMKEDRIKFLEMKFGKNSAFDISGEQLENIAVRSTGMSLAQLDSAAELALRLAIRNQSTKVTDEIFEEAFETFNGGEAKKWESSQLERIARHEAGHTFMCWYCGETPSYVTIIARGNRGGYMQHGDNEGKALYTRSEIISNIKTALAGRAAEIVYYGEEDGVSTGAAGDLAAATATAQRIICTYGMDSQFGLAVSSPLNSSGEMQNEVREAVNRILAEQMEQTIEIIRANRDKLDALVDTLMKKNYMTGAQINEILSDK